MIFIGFCLLFCVVLFFLTQVNGKLVSLFLWLRKLLYFVECFWMCRAQFVVDVFALEFNFWHFVCNTVVALFFEALSWTSWLFFRGKLLTDASFVVRWFASVSLARVSQFFLAIFCFCLCSGLLLYATSVTPIFLWSYWRIPWLFWYVSNLHFSGKNQFVASICPCSFCFFC